MFRIVEDGAPPFPEGISDPLRRFLGACFRRDPLERPAADDLFKYEWVQHGLHFDQASWLDSSSGDLRILTSIEQVLSNNDSIPFLRRISLDGHRPDSLADIRRYMEQAHTGSSRPPSCVLSDGLSATFGSPQTSPRTPAVAIPEESPKHSFVRTRFGTGERSRRRRLMWSDIAGSSLGVPPVRTGTETQRNDLLRLWSHLPFDVCLYHGLDVHPSSWLDKVSSWLTRRYQCRPFPR